MTITIHAADPLANRLQRRASLSGLPRLYTDLAPWWPLLSSPDDYVEEAEEYVIGDNSELWDYGGGEMFVGIKPAD